MVTAVTLLGRGRIGARVADWLRRDTRHDLGAVLSRDSTDWSPAPLAIDAAGPAALRRFGPRLLAEGELWTVGAAALADPEFLGEMQAISARTGNRLRLFTGWVSGVGLVRAGTDAALHIRQSAPGLHPFEGPLAEAVARFPDHLNTACAAALCGPGIARTTVALHDAPPGAPHEIRARLTLRGSVLESAVGFDGTGSHPVAEAIIAALERRGATMTYG